ncbi:MAG: hypothetical protein LIP05_06910 [Tannerellaceae bacterium]|nr:hypothetical protein [Tannerellaceae bacterium]
MKRLIIYPFVLSVLFLLSSCHKNEDNFDATGTFEATEVLVSSEAN